MSESWSVHVSLVWEFDRDVNELEFETGYAAATRTVGPFSSRDQAEAFLQEFSMTEGMTESFLKVRGVDLQEVDTQYVIELMEQPTVCPNALALELVGQLWERGKSFETIVDFKNEDGKDV